VTGITYRHPSLLATEAVTVDHISNGRLELAVGAAWHEPEHRRLGLEFPPAGERVDRLEEAVQVMRALMTEDAPRFEGRHFRLEGGYNPKPVQQPHPPIWIGGHGPRMVALAARHADVWHTFGRPDDLKQRSEMLSRHAETAGRDPSSIVRSTALSLSQTMAEVRADAQAKADAGFTYLTIGWPSEGRERLDEFIGAAMADVAAM
ncbi:MAG TPA: LLM class flavin-dependent oxidoreductase, partial [Actinomycetota bacterium]|nr:LLM class flavin-dependent oxidoreductase [Actinomycetota bacterium]